MWIALAALLVVYIVGVVAGTGGRAIAAIVGGSIFLTAVPPFTVVFFGLFLMIAIMLGRNFTLSTIVAAVAVLAGIAAGVAVVVVIVLIGFTAAGSLIVTMVAAGTGAGAVIIGVLAAGLTASLATVAFTRGDDRASIFTGDVNVAVAVTVAIAGSFAGAMSEAGAIAGAIVGAVVFAGASFFAALRAAFVKQKQQGFLLSFFVPVMILISLGGAQWLSSLKTWGQGGPLLLFLGLLTLLNAPFDWASLGVTRALLRRGLEIGGWWPYALALVDAGLAAVIIAALAPTIVVGVQAFDALAVHGGGTPVLPLEALFNGIAEHPTAPEFWWLYALLLSTMIPSLVNLIIGGTSLVRGLPGVPSLLLPYIPERGGVLRWDRHWVATVLTAQVAAGAALGIAAQAFLVVVIIGYVMPLFGPELLDIARGVAALDLPARVGQLFGVSL